MGAINSNKDLPYSELSTLQTSLQQLQKEYSSEKERTLSLQKVTTNLESSVHKYALLLSEEKNERKKTLEKYDALQNKYHSEIQKIAQKYYLLIGACIVLLVLLVFQYADDIRELIMKQAY